MLFKQICVGGKGKDDEEIEIDMKRFEFDRRKRTYYITLSLQ